MSASLVCGLENLVSSKRRFKKACGSQIRVARHEQSTVERHARKEEWRAALLTRECVVAVVVAAAAAAYHPFISALAAAIVVLVVAASAV